MKRITDTDLKMPTQENIDTCREARDSIEPFKNNFRAEIYNAIKSVGSLFEGFTCDELEQKTGRLHQSVSATLNSLERDGLVYKSIEKRNTRSGRKARVYKLKQSFAIQESFL